MRETKRRDNSLFLKRKIKQRKVSEMKEIDFINRQITKICMRNTQRNTHKSNFFVIQKNYERHNGSKKKFGKKRKKGRQERHRVDTISMVMCVTE